MKTQSLVSVIMCVYNGEKYINAAVVSILKQSYTNFELIVIDDNSSDKTIEILKKFRDKRLTIKFNSQHLGVAKCLNNALTYAKGYLVARMDADDISEPLRLETQVNFLILHPDIGLVGNWVRLIDHIGKKMGYKKFPESDEKIKKLLTYTNPFIHPSVMFRRELIQKHGMYNEQLNGAEDYDLWIRLAKYTKFATIPKVLLQYRIHNQNVSFRNATMVHLAYAKVQIRKVFTYGYPIWHLFFAVKAIFSACVSSSVHKLLYTKFYSRGVRNKIKVVMLCEYFYPFDRGGSEWSVADLSKKMVKHGVEIEIFTPNYGAEKHAQFQNVKIYRFPFYFRLFKSHTSISPIHFTNTFWWLWTSFELLKFCLVKKPDIIHVQGKYFLPTAVLVGKLLKIPTVATLRDYIVLCPHAFCIRKERDFRRCSLTEVLKEEINIYIKNYTEKGKIIYLLLLIATFNGWVASFILQFFVKRIDARISISNKLAKIYNLNGISIDQVIYNTFTSPFIQKKITYEKKKLLFVGRLTPGKGVMLLVQAYSRLCKFEKMPKLEIIGDGPLKEKLVTDFSHLITFKGHLSYTETLKEISRARLVVVPSFWEEPFGRVALEAICLGTPVVVSDRGALPEIVTNKKTGIIVKPTVSKLCFGIKEALVMENNLRKNIQNTQNWIRQKFSEQPTNEYLSLYQKLCS